MKVFLSYSHRDENTLKRLNVHLAVLQREQHLEVWFDHKILAGSEIDQEISEKLESSHLVLLLISPDFLASDYCTSREMKRALDRHESGNVRVVPIILEPCDWKNTSLGRLKALPKDGMPISNWENLNDAFTDIVRELRRILRAEESCSDSHQGTSRTVRTVDLVEPRSSIDYRIKREFNDIEISCFRDDAFGIIRDYFQQSSNDIDKLEDVSARFVHRSSTCCVCTIINSALRQGTAHITVHAGTENRALGDIYYSFKENASTNEAHGMFSIQSDDYELYLVALMDGGKHDTKLTPEMVAQKLWKKFLEQAGITQI